MEREWKVYTTIYFFDKVPVWERVDPRLVRFIKRLFCSSQNSGEEIDGGK